MPNQVSQIIEPYFSHDYSALSDKKIKKLIKDMGFEGYGLFWAVVEFMHREELEVGEEDLILGEDYREKIEKVLNNFQLFKVVDGVYISERILKNISSQNEKKSKMKELISIRWLFGAYEKAYEREFGNTPILTKNEKSKLIEYSNQIENLKDRFADIFYTIHGLKFDNGVVADSSWLLANDNLIRILNGHFGKLKKKLSPEEEISRANANVYRDETESITNKSEGINLILSACGEINERTFNNPFVKKLMTKFKISQSEIYEAAENDG